MRNLLATVAIAASPAAADDLPDLVDFLVGLDGSEVSVSGLIGYDQNVGANSLFVEFQGAEWRIPTTPAVNRQQLSLLEYCLFDFVNPSPCSADMALELRFSTGEITAVLFDIRNVSDGAF